MARPNITAVDVGRRRLLVLHVRNGPDGLVVRHLLDAPIPTRVDPTDAAALGGWVGKAMAEAGVPRNGVLLALGREHLSLKVLDLPTSEADELPDMVRLAVRRDLPIDADTAAIDFVEIVRRDRATSVLAAAAPLPVVQFARTLAEAAGIRLGGIGVRCLGTAALLAAMDLPEGPYLCIDLTGEGVEFTLVDRGVAVFSRGVALRADPGDLQATADAVVTEMRRTWLAYGAAPAGPGAPTVERAPSTPEEPGPDRVNETAPTLRRAVVLGETRLASRVAPIIADIVGAPAEIISRHPRVRGGDAPLDGAWPLAGMLLAPASARVDLAHPRQAPDLAARRRKSVIAAAAVVVLSALLAYTFGAQQKRREIDRHDDIVAKARNAKPEAMRFRRDELKVRHLETWALTQSDWLDRFASVQRLLPEPGSAVLDTLSGRQETAPVRWSANTGWSVDAESRIVLEGEARTRRLADEFRQRLVDRGGGTVTTSGSDARGGSRLPFAFGYTVKSAVRATAPSSDAGTTEAPPASAGSSADSNGPSSGESDSDGDDESAASAEEGGAE
ncbi:MAG: hypothetical protein KDA22_12035 [Phycisphaerales bacterium]|nr:hypothetical protein [Phycisphaerales bacterium]